MCFNTVIVYFFCFSSMSIRVALLASILGLSVGQFPIWVYRIHLFVAICELNKSWHLILRICSKYSQRTLVTG